MATLIGVVSQVVGEVFAVAGDGTRRPLVEGDRVYAGEQLTTGASGAVAVALSNGETLTLGRDSSLGLNEQMLAISDAANTAVAPDEAPPAPSDSDLTDVEQLQAAIEAGVDPTVEGEATAAGPGAGAGAGGAGGDGGGFSFVLLDAVGGAVDPEIGFPTAGLNFVPEFPDPDPEPFDLAADVPVPTDSTPIIDVEYEDDSGTVIVGPAVVDEAALSTGTNPGSAAEQANGNLIINSPDGVSSLQIQGFDGVWVDVTAGGVVIGQYGTLTVDAAGNWTYTLSGNTLNHADPNASGAADQVGENFPVRMFDLDGGESPTVLLEVLVNDDAPIQNEGEGALVSAIVDEDETADGISDGDGDSNSASGGPGALGVLVDFGADGIGSFGLSASPSAIASLQAQGLTSGGTALVYSVVGNVLTASAGEQTVFTLQVGADGSFSFTLLGPLDHSNADGNDDELLELPIDFSALLTATDGDGDSVGTFSGGRFVINVEDDVPQLVGGEGQAFPQVRGLVHEDALQVGAGAPYDGNAEGGQTLTASGPAGSLTALVNFGADGFGSFGLSSDVSSLTLQGLTSGGAALSYVVVDNVLTASAGGQPVFTLTVNADGSWTFVLSRPLDHPLQDGDDLEGLPGLGIDFSGVLAATDGDGDPVVGGFRPGSLVIDVQDDVPVLAEPGEQTSIGGVVHEDALTTPHDGNDDAVQTLTVSGGEGSLNALVTFGADGPGAFGLSGDPAAIATLEAQGLTSGEVPLNYVVVDNVLTASAGGQPIFTLTVQADGSWEFVLSGPLDHPLPGSSDDGQLLGLPIDFSGVLSATDGDGDPVGAFAEGSLVVNVQDDVPVARSDTATVVAGQTQDVNLVFVLDFSGSINDIELDQMLDAVRAAGQQLFNNSTGAVQIQIVAFSGDSLAFAPVSDINTFTTLVNSINPSEGGVRPLRDTTDFADAIQETMSSYVPLPGWNNQVVFISDGNPNEQTGPGGAPSLVEPTASAWANFVSSNAINVTTVGVGSGIDDARLEDLDVDGGPNNALRVDDFADLVDTLVGQVAGGQVSGNVLLGSDNAVGGGDDDAFGADGPGRIASIEINGTLYTWDGVVDGDEQLLNITTAVGGKLSFNFNTGAWTYQTPAGVAGDQIETFTYTIVDNDGDPASASLSIYVEDLSPVIDQVDEDELPSGNGDGDTVTTIATGSLAELIVGPPVSAQFALSTDTSGLQVATSNGVALSYSVDTASNTLSATAGPGGAAVFTLQVASNGDYTFTLLGPLDHPTAGTDDNELLVMDFASILQASDSAGPVALAGGFLIQIENDVPILQTTPAANDSLQVDESDLTVDAVTNFSSQFTQLFGGDGAGTTTYSMRVSANGTDSGLRDADTGLTIRLYLQAGEVVGRVGNYLGEVAFRVTVDSASGEVTLNQLRAIAHNPDSGPDQETSLAAANMVQLVGTIVDFDGDSGTAALDLGHAISFRDDGPSAGNVIASRVLDDEGLSGGINGGPGDAAGANTSTSGTLSFNAGADGLKAIELTGPASLGSESVTSTWNAATNTLTISSIRGDLLTVVLTDLATGAYTVNLLKPLMHPTGGTEDDITLSVGYKVTDKDDDSATGSLTVSIDDDSPTIQVGALDYSSQVTYEGSLAGYANSYGYYLKAGDGTPLSGKVIWANVHAQSGGDSFDLSALDPAQIGFFIIPNGGLNAGLVNGTDVTFQLVSGKWQAFVGSTPLQGADGANVLFSDATLNPGGSHLQDTSSPGNQNWEDLTNASDYDYDDVSTNVTWGASQQLQVDESNLALNATADFAGLFNVQAGADGLQSLVYQLSVQNANSGLVDTASGENVLLSVNGVGTVEGRTASSNELVFTLSVAADGKVTLDQLRAIVHPTSDPDEAKFLGQGHVSLSATATDNDGDTAVGNLDLGKVISFKDDAPSAGSNLLVQLDDDALPKGIPGGTGDDSDAQNATGFLSHSYGADGAGTISWVNTGAPAGYTYEASGNALLIKQGATLVLTVTLTNSATGAYSVVQNAPIQHATADSENNQAFQLTYKVTDKDGDSANGTLNINVDDDTPLAQNDVAYVSSGQTTNINMVFVLDFSGSIDNSELNLMLDAVRTAGQELFNGATGDVKIQIVAFSQDSIGYPAVDNITAFTNLVNSLNPSEPGGVRPFNGNTDFTDAIQQTMLSYAPLTGWNNQVVFISDGNPNEQLGTGGNSLSDATASQWNTFVDSNGITVTTVGVGSGIIDQRLVDVDKDAGPNNTPLRSDDFDDLVDTLLDSVVGGLVNGNVLYGSNGVNNAGTGDDDSFGADGPGRIMSIEINGTTYVWNGAGIINPSSGPDIAGNQLSNVLTAEGGRLDFNFATGAWTYRAPSTVSGDKVETFDYVIVDKDGDPSAATLTVYVEDASPVIAQVDEDALPGGISDGDTVTTIATGSLASLVVGPATGVQFSLSGSTGGLAPASSGGVALVYSVAGDTLTAKAGASGSEVFKLKVESDGDYTFTLLKPLDHAPGGNDDTALLTLDFASILQAVNGSTPVALAGQFLVQVEDDVPTASANPLVRLDDDALANGIAGGPAGTDDINSENASSILGHNFGADGAGTVQWLTSGAPGGFTYQTSGTSLLVKQGTTTVLTVTLNSTSGAYTVTQNAPIQHANADLENNQAFTLSYRVTDKDGDYADGTLSISVDDDSPVANAISKTGQAAIGTDTNLMIVLDISGSMGDAAGVGGMNRLEVAKSALLELFEQYDALGSVKVSLVTFASGATTNQVWVNLSDAKAAVLALNANGNTNYDAALINAINAYGQAGSSGGKLATANVQNVAYFLSDGYPNQPSGDAGISNSNGTATNWPTAYNDTAGTNDQASEEQTWINFLTDNGIRAYSLGMGTGVGASALNPIAYDGTTGTNTDAIVVSNLSNLTATLVATAQASPINGNLKDNGGGFGADGGFVRSLTVGGTTYTYNGTNAMVGATPGASFNSTTHILTILLAASAGTLAVNMDSAAFTYTPPDNIGSSGINQSIGFVLQDFDGDQAGNTLSILIDPAQGVSVIRDDLVLTNQSDAFVIPDWALLQNDTGPLGATQSISGVGSASGLSSLARTAGGVSVDDDGTAGGSFVYTNSASPSDPATVDVVRSSGSTINGSFRDEILIGGSGNDTLNGGEGRDVLIGGGGRDTLNGGNGADTVVVGAVVGSSSDSARVAVSGNGNDVGQDTLQNFNLSEDVVRVVASNVGNFTHGANTAVGSAGNGADGAGVSSYTALTGLIDLNADGTFNDAGDIVLTFSSPTGSFNEASFESRLQYELYGTSGNNTLAGGALSDVLVGNGGNDTLTGGAGADTFKWLAGSTGTTTITDFSKGVDSLDLSQLLVGEDSTASSLSQYLTFSFSTNTTITVDANAGVAGGAGQSIVLGGINLQAAYGAADAAGVINGMLGDGTLKVDTV